MYRSRNTTTGWEKRDIFWIKHEVPAAMEKMRWEMAPKLMRYWFSIEPAFAFDRHSKNFCLNADARTLPKARYNDSIITMRWAIRYKQVLKALNKLKMTWSSINGLNTLRKRLNKIGDYKNESLSLGYEVKSIALDATAQVNIESLGSMLDTLDDFYGAIGKASLKVAVRGTSSQIEGKPVFIVEALGFYLKDTYDFLDKNISGIAIPEPLGWWNKNGTMNKVQIGLYLSSFANGMLGFKMRELAGYTLLTNADFRQWQDRYCSGGDFILYSDVLWMPPLPKDRVIFL